MERHRGVVGNSGKTLKIRKKTLIFIKNWTFGQFGGSRKFQKNDKNPEKSLKIRKKNINIQKSWTFEKVGHTSKMMIIMIVMMILIIMIIRIIMIIMLNFVSCGHCIFQALLRLCTEAL